MNNKWYLHTLDASKNSYCPNFLQKLRSKKWVLETFYWDDLVVKETSNFLVSLKNAPYSDRDLFVIYSWDNENISSIDQFSDTEFSELIEILQNLFNNLVSDYKTELESGKSELILWLNTSVFPWPWMVQSVFRPHIHITLLNTLDTISNNVKTELIDIVNNCDKQKRFFCIRPENNYFLNNFLDYFKISTWFKKNDNDFEVNDDYIDFLLTESELFDENNINYIKEIYSSLNFYLKSFSSDIKNGIIPNFWFSLWFRKSIKWLNFRVKFFVKKENDNWWSMEIFYHSISRNRVDNPILPDMKSWKDRIKSYN